jgi:hypothetical protein
MENTCLHNLDIGDGISLFAVFGGISCNFTPQISKYVSEVFVKTLKKLRAYSLKNYEEALDLTFRSIDELLASDEINHRLQMLH